MAAKDLHIVTVGASLIGHAKGAKIAGLSGNEEVSDEAFWRTFRGDHQKMAALGGLLNSDPKRFSAELNSFLRAVAKQNKQPSEVAVYLVGTDTAVGRICLEHVSSYLRGKGYEVMQGTTPASGFAPGQDHEEQAAKLQEGLVKLLDRLIEVAEKNAAIYERIFFNPTGGMKAHVMTGALAGFMTGCPVYYMHEEFKDVVFIPPLFYMPSEDEQSLLRTLENKQPWRGTEYQRLGAKYKNRDSRLDNLERFGLISRERDPDTDVPFGGQITAKGLKVLKFLQLARDE